MMRMIKKVWAIILVSVFLLLNLPVNVSAATLGNQTTNVQDGLTLHCWNWSYKNIEANMEKIASQGYSAIQTSPIQQAKEATKGYSIDGWWVYYQPMGFHIDNTGNSALGTKAEFESMCKTAHKYGIKVIVDVVANHLGNNTGNDLSNVIVEDIKNDPNCWHDISKNTYDYSKRYDITQWCMNGLPDLNTGNKKVQNYVLGFLKECIDAGADGFRFDAAKHIETPDDGNDNCASDFWPTVVNGAKAYAKSSRGIDLYCYGELLDNPGGTLHISSYTKYMSVTDNSYSSKIRGYVNRGWTNEAGSPYYSKDCGASQLVLWAESHDTWADGTTSAIDTAIINKTWAIIAARADAMSLYFARPNSKSDKLGMASFSGWAQPAVKQINLFHNAFVGQSEYMATEQGIVYCERGDSGVVLVNCVGSQRTVNVTAHNIKDGKYIDQISGATFTVADGRISGTIGELGIAVVYNTDNNSNVATQKNIVYLELPSGWNEPVHCYIYDQIKGEYVQSWPGVQMEKVSENLFKYEIPSYITAPCVIFKAANGRYPGEMDPGLFLEGSMIYSNGEWKKYEVDTNGSVVINYKDKDGNVLLASETISGKTGTSYKISVKDIDGYSFVRSEGELSGIYSDGVSSIILVYEKTETPTSEIEDVTDGTEPTENDTTSQPTENDTTSQPTENDTTTEVVETTEAETTDSDKGDVKENDTKFPWPFVAVPVGVILVGGVIFVLIRNKQKNM